MLTRAPTRIAIYADRDSRASSAPLDQEIRRNFPDPRFIIDRVTRDDLLKPGFFDNLVMFVLPGIEGETSLYHEHIGPANALIRDYVAQGGVFFGQCAGANYAGRGVVFEPHWAPKRTRDEGLLGLFNGLTVGPPAGLGVDGNDPDYFRGLTTTNIVTDALENAQEFPVAYSSGPTFLSDAGQSFRTHARYADVPGQPPATISFAYGRGLVILSGPVPQYGGRPATGLPGYEKRDDVLRRLLAVEGYRIRFFDSLMNNVRKHASATLGLTV